MIPHTSGKKRPSAGDRQRLDSLSQTLRVGFGFDEVVNEVTTEEKSQFFLL